MRDINETFTVECSEGRLIKFVYEMKHEYTGIDLMVRMDDERMTEMEKYEKFKIQLF